MIDDKRIHKEELYEYVKVLIDLKYEFEKKGICVLKEHFINGDRFEKIMCSLVIQGYSSETIQEVFSNLISSDSDKLEYDRHVLLVKFLLFLQRGVTSDTELIIVLLSYVGIDYLDVYLKDYKLK